jgi:single-stranded DNA-binding protein
LRLAAGDAVSVQGSAKLGTFQARDGTWRASLEVVAAQVLALRQLKKPRPAKEAAPPLAPAFDDALPF